MKSFGLIIYLNIIISNKVILASNVELKELSVDIISNMDFNTTLNDVKRHLEQNSDIYTNFQCSIKNTDCDELHLPFPELVKRHGYPAEVHEVETSDGYLLKMFRIPNEEGPPALLVHGGSLSAYDFVTMGSQAGLGYRLADAGYDVWFANCRGTKDSIGHVILPTNSKAYWDFGWDEMGRYDLPVFIDHILNTTNAKDVKLIGHSQGTNVMLLLCAEKPEYNNKISVMILLSATTHVSHSKFPLFKLVAAPTSPDFYQLGKAIGLYSLFTNLEIGPILDLVKNTFCATPETANAFCHNLLFAVFGADYSQVNQTSLPVVYGHFPNSISLKGAQHYIQLARSGKFRQYDYGEYLNLKKYGSEDPPEYPLHNVKTKVVIFKADNDFVCSEQDHQILLHKLPNVIDVYRVEHEMFTHMDFVFAKDVKSLVYDKVLEILKST